MTLTATVQIERVPAPRSGRGRHALDIPPIEFVDDDTLFLPTTEQLYVITDMPRHTISVPRPRRVKYEPVSAKEHVAIIQERTMTEIWPRIGKAKTSFKTKVEHRLIAVSSVLATATTSLMAFAFFDGLLRT